MIGPPVTKRAGDLATTSPNYSALDDDTPIFGGGQFWCNHNSTRIVIEWPGSTHFAREVCLNCDRVLRWLPKPSTVQHRRLNAYRIAKLAMCDRLSAWERSFIKSISQRQKLSPKQEAVIERLAATYLREG